MRSILGSRGVLALLVIVASGLAASNTATPSPDTAGDLGVESAQSLAPSEAPLSAPAPATPLEVAVAPHCCSTGAAAACRDFCKQQGPGCKGAIGCRAGECVCTCNCP